METHYSIVAWNQLIIMFNDMTLILCIDKDHINELQYAWKTWKYFKPEITTIPNKILLYDTTIKNQLGDLKFIDSTYSLYEFKNRSYYFSQRDAMLTSWFEAARQVKTKFYLKIDTDCFATNNDSGWINAISDRDNFRIISNPWGYTKNPQRLINLDNWGDAVDYINNTPRLNLLPAEGSNKVIHSRIISFLGIFDTDWTHKISESCWKNDHYELPDPSQDTFTWYCAQRRQDPIKKVRFKKFGFSHTRLKKIKEQLISINII